MHNYKIAVVSGDGIGPEVIAAGRAVLDAAAAQAGGFALEYLDAPAGAGTYQKCGDELPASSLATCRDAHAILLGACGLPGVRHLDGTEITPQVWIRRALDLYAGIRPARTIAGVPGPLGRAPDIDLVIVRESTEGAFASHGQSKPIHDEVVHDLLSISRRGTERVARAAFELARRRGRAKPRVTCVDKANVLQSFAFFRKVFDEVATGYGDIEVDHLYADATALELVRRPERFDVIVTENLLGDILSDLAAGLVGGMGMAPSADIGDHHAVFQPCHGTAPDLAGQGVANPIATILSCACCWTTWDASTTTRGLHRPHSRSSGPSRSCWPTLASTPRTWAGRPRPERSRWPSWINWAAHERAAARNDPDREVCSRVRGRWRHSCSGAVPAGTLNEPLRKPDGLPGIPGSPMMYSHEVICTHADCSDTAVYKVAARWSDGRFAELKTYGFACSDHLGEVFQDAENRRLDYTLCPGEVIEEMAIYRYEPGRRDRQLQRLWGLEENYRV